VISNAKYSQQKAALTRAINTGDPDKIRKTVRKAVTEWGHDPWPDDWARWQRALDDHVQFGLRLEDL
jgi:hypothetical protein